MRCCQIIALLAALSTLYSNTAIASNKPVADPQAQQLIESLALREGEAALRDHSRWKKPSYIVAIIPAQLSAISGPLLHSLKQSAGDIEIKVYTPDGSGLPDYVKNAEVIFGSCSKALIDQMPKLIWMQNSSSGSEYCTSQAGVKPGDFILTNAKKMGAVPIAEHAISLTLMLHSNLHVYHRNQLDSLWKRQLTSGPSSASLSDKTMLILGLGGIGKEVAKRANALGIRVIATRNSSRNGPDYVAKVGLASEMIDLAKEADIIVNALPLTPKTNNVIGDEFFNALKPGSLYISVGRGLTTNTDALIKALESHRLAGAALDVTNPEPLPPNHPLWMMDNVVITPHVAGFSMAAIQRTFILYRENLRRYLNGDKLLNVVDIERGY